MRTDKLISGSAKVVRGDTLRIAAPGKPGKSFHVLHASEHVLVGWLFLHHPLNAGLPMEKRRFELREIRLTIDEYGRLFSGDTQVFVTGAPDMVFRKG